MHRWAQLDELVIVGNSEQAVSRLRVSRLQQMDASSQERMLLAGVRVLVGEAGNSGAVW